MLGVIHANLFVGGVSSVSKLYRALECVFSDNHINIASMPYRELLAAVLRMASPLIVLRRGAKRIRDFFATVPPQTENLTDTKKRNS